MKAGIHPAYNEVNVICACGHKFATRSTHKGDIGVEICASPAQPPDTVCKTRHRIGALIAEPAVSHRPRPFLRFGIEGPAVCVDDDRLHMS